MTDFATHLTRQAAASRGFYGPGARTKGVIQHVKKELVEIEKCYDGVTPTDGGTAHEEAAQEWVDVAILGLDGLLRAIAAAYPYWTFDAVAQHAVKLMVAKQGKNELRDWPDWRLASPDSAIEHVRGKHD